MPVGIPSMLGQQDRIQLASPVIDIAAFKARCVSAMDRYATDPVLSQPELALPDGVAEACKYVRAGSRGRWEGARARMAHAS